MAPAYPHTGMKIELITRRTGRPPTPWSWEIVDATCTLVQRSRTNFATADIAREQGQAALLAYREASGEPEAAPARR